MGVYALVLLVAVPIAVILAARRIHVRAPTHYVRAPSHLRVRVPAHAMSSYHAEAYRPTDDEEILLSWEEEQLRALGFNEFQARALSAAGISWHDAERLIRRGCPPELALDLLLP
mgnify:CR=1 FL=1